MSEERKSTVTPTGRICFIKNLFSPNDKEKYTATLLLDKSQNLKDIKALMMEAARSKFKEEEIKSKKFSWGIKTPDEDSMEQYDFFDEDTIVLNAATKFEVEVKSAHRGHDGKYEDLIEGDLKAGDYCRFLISAYPWEYEKKKGVSLNLMAVQMLKEGEALYSRRPSDDFFGEADIDIELEEQNAAGGSSDSEDTVDGADAFDW